MLNFKRSKTNPIAMIAIVFVIGLVSVVSVQAYHNGNSSNGNNSDSIYGGFFRERPTLLTARLNGESEVPDPGDDDGTGFAFVKVMPRSGELCYFVIVNNILLPASGAHIHEGAEGIAGDVVIALDAPDEDGMALNCVQADTHTLREIRNDPQDYYVNIHNPDFPDGAIRGQLMKW